MSDVKPFLSQKHERSEGLAQVFERLDLHLHTKGKENNKKEDKKAIYMVQRDMLDALFAEQKVGSKEEERRLLILNRLTLLDALYSTSVNRYQAYAMVDIAKAIADLGTDDEYVAKLANWLNNPADKTSDGFGLFDQRFGDLSRKPENDMAKWEKGRRAVSLLSKYSYYLFRQPKYRKLYPSGFPIYDSLAKESYARLVAYMGDGAKGCPKTTGSSIVSYLKAIKALGETLWGSDEVYLQFGYKLQRFDLLDTYLWHLGKFEKKSYSLLLEREDFAKIKALQEQQAAIVTVLSQIKDPLFAMLYQHQENLFNHYNV